MSEEVQKTGTIVAKSKNGMMLKMGETSKDWVWMSEAVQKFAGSKVKSGDTITYKESTVNGKPTITFIEGGGTGGSSKYSGKKGGYGGKSPEESVRISKLSILSSCATFLAGANVGEQELISLYDTFVAKVLSDETTSESPVDEEPEPEVE